jgi:hypothetical protein
MRVRGQARPSGELRQSQVISTFGPGALVDLPRFSVLVGGLEGWSKRGRIEIQEARLVTKIEEWLETTDVRLFTPPVDDGDPVGERPGIAVWRFPEWVVTEVLETASGRRSRRLVPLRALTKDQYIDDDKKRRSVVPIRFVRACRRGHIGDIDWYRFVHRGDTQCRRQLWLDERGTSGDLSEVWIRCDCRAERAMSEAAKLSNRALGVCDGARPWLGQFTKEACTEPNRLLVRTASNSYFPQVVSVISLPDRDESIVRAVDRVWETVQYVKAIADLEQMMGLLPPVKAALEGCTAEQVMEEIWARSTGKGAGDVKPVKLAELEVLMSAQDEIGADVPDGMFFARSLNHSQWNTTKATGLIDRVVLVHRLREVRAQLGFTRFESIAPDADGELDVGVQMARLSREESWLPAVENRGEGVFVAFRQDAIDAWKHRADVLRRGQQLMRGFDQWNAGHGGKQQFPGLPYIMLHSLSHLLLTAISLECGYPASSIRERVYAGASGCGILLYTGSPDAEGTLGGLVESGRRIAGYLDRAIEAGRLCSNDPVCAAHNPDDDLSAQYLLGAACHGCLLIAETSCERHNDLLDRALVVPTMEDLYAEILPG